MNRIISWSAFPPFSCLNPIIYGFMSKNFRESFLFSIRRLCRFRGRRGQPHIRRQSDQGRTNKLFCCREASPEMEANRSQVRSRHGLEKFFAEVTVSVN